MPGLHVGDDEQETAENEEARARDLADRGVLAKRDHADDGRQTDGEQGRRPVVAERAGENPPETAPEALALDVVPQVAEHGRADREIREIREQAQQERRPDEPAPAPARQSRDEQDRTELHQRGEGDGGAGQREPASLPGDQETGQSEHRERVDVAVGRDLADRQGMPCVGHDPFERGPRAHPGENEHEKPGRHGLGEEEEPRGRAEPLSEDPAGGQEARLRPGWIDGVPGGEVDPRPDEVVPELDESAVERCVAIRVGAVRLDARVPGVAVKIGRERRRLVRDERSGAQADREGKDEDDAEDADPQAAPAEGERGNEERECDELPCDLRPHVAVAAEPELEGEQAARRDPRAGRGVRSAGARSPTGEPTSRSPDVADDVRPGGLVGCDPQESLASRPRAARSGG